MPANRTQRIDTSALNDNHRHTNPPVYHAYTTAQLDLSSRSLTLLEQLQQEMSFTPLGLYLFKRLHSLGIRSILGVPGDYSTSFMISS